MAITALAPLTERNLRLLWLGQMPGVRRVQRTADGRIVLQAAAP